MVENVYFIGIGGIGMSAIARYYNHAGYRVSGYDRTPTPLTAALESEGIAVHYKSDISAIPAEREKTLVIYTPAIPADFEELSYVTREGYKVVKRSRALGEIAKGEKTVAVAGTHGKTTTSTLISHIFTDCGMGCSAFLGGISKNYGTNLLLSKNRLLVAEADEFDRSFLQLYPDIAIITSADPDHLDIYGTYDAVKEAFVTFASQVKGSIVIKKGVSLDLGKITAKCYSYSLDSQADFHADRTEIVEGGYFKFDLICPSGKIEGCTMGVPGRVNAENGVAAAAAAILAGVAPEEIKRALKSFSGVRRRLDVHINTPQTAYIDDYAHHPREISSAINSLREIFPGRRLCGIFQPHLYTRTRDFAEGFAESLSLLDKLILLDIYPAREEPIRGVTSEIIFDKVRSAEKVMLSKEELLPYLEKEPIDVLATFGAGDIDKFVEPITNMLLGRTEKKKVNDV